MAPVFELFGVAKGLMRQSLRRQFPEDTPEEIEERLAQWILSTPLPVHEGLAPISEERQHP